MNKELVEQIKDAEAEAAARIERAKQAAMSATDAARTANAARAEKAYEDARLAMYSRISAAAEAADREAAGQIKRGRADIERICKTAGDYFDAAVAAVTERIGG